MDNWIDIAQFVLGLGGSLSWGSRSIPFFTAVCGGGVVVCLRNSPVNGPSSWVVEYYNQSTHASTWDGSRRTCPRLPFFAVAGASLAIGHQWHLLGDRTGSICSNGGRRLFDTKRTGDRASAMGRFRICRFLSMDMDVGNSCLLGNPVGFGQLGRSRNMGRSLFRDPLGEHLAPRRYMADLANKFVASVACTSSDYHA